MKIVKPCEHKQVQINNTKDKLPIYHRNDLIDYRVIIYQLFDCRDCGKSWDEKLEYLASTLKNTH